MSEERPLVERAQRALRGEEPWEPIMDRIYTFVRGDLDARIATLTERLRIVEAERDASAQQFRAELQQMSDSGYKMRDEYESKLSDLRAELERKDAALKDVDGNFDIYTTIVRGGVKLPRLQMEPCLEYAWRAARAALQPKEPPCKS